jgi:hypothetical protein
MSARPANSTSSYAASRDSALADALDDTFAQLVELQAREGGRSGDAIARAAVVAIASALLRHACVQQHRVPPTTPLSRLASALLSETPATSARDVATALGALFERALGPSGKRDQGAVYTPPDIVDFMVIEAIAARIVDVVGLSPAAARRTLTGDLTGVTDDQAQAIGSLLVQLRIVDPAVGAGAFLVGASHRLANLAVSLSDRGVRGISHLRTAAGALGHCCHGFEFDPDAVLIAKAVLALATHDGSPSSPLAVVTERNPLLEGMAHPRAKEGWDVVLMNPPYVGEKYVRARFGDRFVDALREIDGFSGDLLSHFMVRSLAAVRPGGVVSAIVSDTAFTMETTRDLRREIIDRSVPLSVAWCRPFPTVAVQGGVLTVARPPFRSNVSFEWVDAPAGSEIAKARRHRARRDILRQLPGRQIYRPTKASRAILERWSRVESLDTAWANVGKRSAARNQPDSPPSPGSWVLLGTVVRGGQGLATGDDRRFVGAIAETQAAARAAARQRRLLEILRSEPHRKKHWDIVRARLGAGHQLGDALVSVLGEEGDGLPEKKPFRVVDTRDVRGTPLTPDEIRHGITSGPHWIPYETSDRSSAQGGARWARDNPVVLDWSRDAVSLLRRRRESGERRPVLRNEDLWFQGGVTHNRITSYMRARVMPKFAIFSSESPVYVPRVEWLDTHALVALLNAPVVEFILKTFLSSRNHIEVGHLLRVPVPWLTPAEGRALSLLGRTAVAASHTKDPRLHEVEADLDRFTRDLYGVGSEKLPIVR